MSSRAWTARPNERDSHDPRQVIETHGGMEIRPGDQIGDLRALERTFSVASVEVSVHSR